jgi:hypothetical protein
MTSLLRRLFTVFGIATFSSLVACGGSSGGSGSSGATSTSQDPDPVVVDFPIAYVKRPLFVDNNGALQSSSVRDAAQFRPGAELIVRDRASPSAAETVITQGVFADGELYDVKDLSVSYDGMRVVFAMRAPEIPNADDDQQPTWNIWLYDHSLQTLQRVISSDIAAEDGQDVAPRFLPDGRIVFASTRQRQAKAVLLDEGKPQFSALDENRNDPAFALHVMDEFGGDIEQISFNQSSDLDPFVLTSGRIAFSRWDNAAFNNQINLYTSNPDGSDLHLLYGAHSHDTGPGGEQIEFVEGSEMPDGRVLVLLRTTQASTRMGVLPVAIDTQNFMDHDVPTPASQGLLSDAQELVFDGDLNLDDDTPPRQGRYASIAPLFDGTNRVITAWSQCRLEDTTSDANDPVIVPCTDTTVADPIYIEADPPLTGEAYAEVVVMEPRMLPAVILDKVGGVDVDQQLIDESVGVLHIRSVYDFDGTAIVDIPTLRNPGLTTADVRPARFLRLVKAVSMPDDDLVDLDGSAFGVSQQQLMREILGYVPVEPDGSVMVKVPANVAFWIDVLDANGRRITDRHQNWLELKPGQTMTCNGCHTRFSESPHGRLDAQLASANTGAPSDGVPFPNTQPALFANAGETMAETYARVSGIRTPSVDISFIDEWTDPGLRTIDPPFDYLYTGLTTAAPVGPGCTGPWTSICRVVVNYETHIHPIWSVDRQQFAADGSLVRDDTCTSCHNVVDGAGADQVPGAQLDLSDGISDRQADHFKSYQELLANDTELELDMGGMLIERLVQDTDANGNLLFEVDANGDLILDGAGNPIPVMVPVNVAPSLSVQGANAAVSLRFFSLFDGGTHAGWLTDSELKLISEWVDLGAQYYNNPFDVPP